MLLVHAHSNGCDIGDMRQTLQGISESLRVHVMSFEFPGYGLHVGAASQRAIDDAADAVLNFIVRDLQIDIAQVVWYGRSIGSGPTVAICNRITKEYGRNPGGCILQCGYANFPEVAGHLFGVMAKQLVSPLWRNEAMLKEVRCPVLLIHGRNDTMIPLEQSEKLWNAVYQKGKRATLQVRVCARASREVEVTVVSAKSLTVAGGLPNTSCRCTVQGRADLEFHTHAVRDSLSPAWDFRGRLAGVGAGDVLEFEVVGERPQPGRPGPLFTAALELTTQHLGQGGAELDLDLSECGAAAAPEVTGERQQAALAPVASATSASSAASSQKSAWRKKDLSHFYTCDCGHNDFNFRRCTLRPIYDFLLGVVSAEGYPASNFTIEIARSNGTFVHHIGPLRAKMPVYSFRRPELDDWMRKLLKSRVASGDEEVLMLESGEWSDSGALHPGLRVHVRPGAGGAGGAAVLGGQQGVLDTFDVQSGMWRLRLSSGESALLKPENLVAESQAQATSSRPSGKMSGKGPADDADQGPAAKGKKGKKGPMPPPPVPDLTELPAIEDASIALLDAEGMVRTCALRVADWLDRVQRQLDRVEGLESRRLEEVVRLVEAEFWASDPLLCLWEEIRLPQGERVRLRLGPFSIGSGGERSYDPGLGCGSGSAPNLLRVPLWVYAPSAAHFRCLAEWSLLSSERLRRNLPEIQPRGFCCVPSHRLTKRRKHPRRSAEGGQQPSRGALATALAAHFVNWVEKTDEIRALFVKFVDLYKNPEEALRRPARDAELAGAPKEAPGCVPVPECPSGLGEEAEESPPAAAPRRAPPSLDKDGTAGGPLGPPWPAVTFSSTGRAVLRESLGAPGGVLEDLLALQHGKPPVPAEDEEGSQHPLPNVTDFQTMAGIVSSPEAAGRHRSTDWMVSGHLLHYERLLGGHSPSTGEACRNEEAWGDPLRPAMQECGAALNAVMEAYVQAESRERREHLRLRTRQLVRHPPCPQPPGEPDAGLGMGGQQLEEAVTPPGAPPQPDASAEEPQEPSPGQRPSGAEAPAGE